MLPVLVNLPFLKIYTFGVFLLLAFFWGSFMLWKYVLLTAYKEEDIFDSLFVSLIVGLFTSRLVYAMTHFKEFGFNVLRFILINGYPGLSLYGFLAGVTLALYLYFQYKKIKFREAIDYFIPAGFIALGFGKMGAFFAAVEVGTKTTIPLAMKYFGAAGLRHLTPLYESVFFFAGAFAAYKIVFAVRRNTYPKGAAGAFFCWYIAVILMIFDLLKDKRTMLTNQISLNLAVSGVLLLTFTAVFLYYFRSFIVNPFTKHGKSTVKNNHKKT
ncbi:prolipoprotein diacylglyceryl transferase [Candidatus Microgenomates bacterium]|nr:prolipoprotein diacylglyceryl transferase [Candidatus Microgenomates bacterium]